MEILEIDANLMVWAKYSRYPWWPAFLTGNDSNGCREVKFFGSFDYSFVPESAVRPFSDPPKFDKKDQKNRSLQQAILSAQSVVDGKSTILQEIDKVQAQKMLQK